MSHATEDRSMGVLLAPVAQPPNWTLHIQVKSNVLLKASTGPQAKSSTLSSDVSSAAQRSCKHQDFQTIFTTLRGATAWTANYQQNQRKNSAASVDTVDYTIPINYHERLQYVSTLFAAFKTSITEPIPAELGNFTSDANL